MFNFWQPLFTGAGVPAICDALRASNLIDVSLHMMRLLHTLPDGLAVLESLTGHCSVARLEISLNFVQQPESSVAVGEMLGRLIASSSQLEDVNVASCNLGDAGMRPLFEAIAGSRTLRKLDCSYTAISQECARDVILPAVRANTSLRELFFLQYYIVELVEAMRLVAVRQ